jgi:GxxExxY protein
MPTMQLVHKELSYAIIGACFEIHNEIGGGHKEKIYQKGLASCLRNRGIVFREQVRVDLQIAGESVGVNVLDFLVEDKVIVEIKSSGFFRMSDFRQTRSYLQSLDKQLALLVAFTPTGVKYRRILNLPSNS